MSEAPKPLDGISIIDVSGTVGTAYCAKLFADHGATVINVEPPGGHPTRQLAPFIANASHPEASAMHAWLSTNKSSVVLDLQQLEAQRALQDQISSAQLLLMETGEKACTGHPCFDPDQLRQTNKDLVVMSINWFGSDGPYRDYVGSDATVQSLAGMIRGIGPVEGPPLLPTGYQAQIVGGLTAFVGAMTQVLAQELGNKAGLTWLETSILESNLCFTEVGAVATHKLDRLPPRMGVNRFPPTYPLGIFPCRDGWLGVTALTPSQWQAFCALLGMDEEVRNPDYATAQGRLQDSRRIDRIIADKVRDRSAEELFHRGQAMRVPLAPVPTMEQLFDVDQYLERGAFGQVVPPQGQAFQAPTTPFRLFTTPSHPNGRVSALGADNKTLLSTHPEVSP